eukprot:gene25752-31100_t
MAASRPPLLPLPPSIPSLPPPNLHSAGSMSAPNHSSIPSSPAPSLSSVAPPAENPSESSAVPSYAYSNLANFVGPDWPCMMVTYTLLIACTILFIHNIGPYWNPAVTVFAALLCLAAVLCFSMAACSDPGIVFTPAPTTNPATNPSTTSNSTCQTPSLPLTTFSTPTTADSEAGEAMERGRAQQLPGKIECAFCKVLRPVTARHCYDCGVCIDGLDHHCPWTGKCIGKKTLRAFYSFLISLWVLVLYVVAFVVATGIMGNNIVDFTPKS